MKWLASGVLCMAAALATGLALGAEFLPSKMGDLDADGRPTVLDLELLVNHLNGTALLSADLRFFADVNLDGEVNAADATALASAILGLTELVDPFDTDG